MDKNFFLNPQDLLQKKYEALRASYLEDLTDKEVANQFGMPYYSFKSVKRDMKNAVPSDFFIGAIKRGKSVNRTASENMVIQLRKRNY